MKEEILRKEVMPQRLAKDRGVEEKAWDTLLNQRPRDVLAQYQSSLSLIDTDQDREDANYDQDREDPNYGQDLQEQYAEEPQTYPQIPEV